MRAASLPGLSALFIALWTSGWLASRLLIDELSVAALLNARYLIVLLSLLVIVTLARQWRRLSIPHLLAHMCVGVLSHGLYLLAALGALQQGVSAGLITFVITLHPVATAMLSGTINSERFSTRQRQGLLVGSLAVMLLISQSHEQGTSGFALALPFIAVTALTLGSLLNRYLELGNQSGHEPPLPVFFLLLIQSAGALLLLLPIAVVQSSISVDLHSKQWLLLLWLALATSLGAYALLQWLLRHMASTQVACLSYLTPPATMLQSCLVFGDSLDNTELAGMLLAAGAVLWVMRSPGEHTSGPDLKLQACAAMRQEPAQTASNFRLSLPDRRAVDIEL